MANTESNITGFVDRINKSFPVGTESDSIRVALSSHEGTMAQLEFRALSMKRRLLGRKTLSFEVIDHSGMAELQGESPVATLTIPLGRRALIGRANTLGLPLLASETVSDDHLALTFSRGENGHYLSINDESSVNGSHHVVDGTKERTWKEQINELSTDTEMPAHHDSDVDPQSYDFLYDPEKIEYYSGKSPATSL